MILYGEVRSGLEVCEGGAGQQDSGEVCDRFKVAVELFRISFVSAAAMDRLTDEVGQESDLVCDVCR